MGMYRLYTGPDNESHIEELPLESHPNLKELQQVKGIRFQANEGSRFLDFHPAPDRRWLVILSGKVEIGLGDGSKHLFGPGDMRLIEDVTGHGHTTLYVEPGVSAVIPLPD